MTGNVCNDRVFNENEDDRKGTERLVPLTQHAIHHILHSRETFPFSIVKLSFTKFSIVIMSLPVVQSYEPSHVLSVTLTGFTVSIQGNMCRPVSAF